MCLQGWVWVGEAIAGGGFWAPLGLAPGVLIPAVDGGPRLQYHTPTPTSLPQPRGPDRQL